LKTTDGDKGFAPFVQCELDRDDKEAVKSNVLKAVEAADFVAKAVEDGYRVTFAWDAKSDAVSVIMTGISDTCQNRGYALSARAPTYLGAITSLMYKHIHKLGEDWPKTPGGSRRDSWG